MLLLFNPNGNFWRSMFALVHTSPLSY